MTDLFVIPPPLVSGMRKDLYTIYDGVAYRFDGSSGKVIWQTPVSTRVPINNQPNWALLHVVSGVVYAVLTFDIYALDARNGEQIWHVINHTENGYFWAVVDDGRVYLYSLDQTFSALNAADGSLLWHNTAFTTGDGHGFHIRHGHLYTERHTNRGRDCEIVTLDGVTGEVRWYVPVPWTVLSPPLVEQGVVYIVAGKFLSALKELSGERIWEQAISNITLDHLYLADGILYAETFLQTTGAWRRNESVSDRLGRRQIFAFNARTGQLLWNSEPGTSRLLLPLVDGLLLARQETYSIAQGYRSTIVGLDAQTGKVAQSYPLQDAIWGTLLHGTLYLLESVDLPPEKEVFRAKRDFTLKSFHPGTGQLLSAHLLGSEETTFHMVGIGNILVYRWFSEPEYRLVAYHLSDGSLAWNSPMPPPPAQTSSPTKPRSAPVLAP